MCELCHQLETSVTFVLMCIVIMSTMARVKPNDFSRFVVLLVDSFIWA